MSTCMRRLLCYAVFISVQQLLFASETFRVALVSEFSGNFHGNSKNFIEGFRDFVVPVINSLGGIPIGGVLHKIECVDYDTQSNSSRSAEVISAAAAGVDMEGNAVGAAHAIVAGTSKLNKAAFGPAEAAGLVNIHTSGGNPTMWLETNTYAYGLHLPFIWYTRGPIKMAATRGATSIAIIRSMAHGFSKASCTAAIQWSLDAKLNIIGPSVDWCNANKEASGGCQVIGERCVCGSQSDVDAFGLDYDIEKTPNFYQLDENIIGNGLVWRTVDADTTAHVRSMFKDMASQGIVPDIVLNFATEWHNVLKAMVEENITPKMLLGWQDGTTAEWAEASDEQGGVALTAIDGYWAIGFGQWHKAMKFNDPVFVTNANASQMFESQRKRPLDYDTAGAITAGVVLYTALSRHFKKSFVDLSLVQKRDAVKQAVDDLNDETMWGTLNFNSRHQNIGRGTAAWQIIPNTMKEPQQLCVLPVEAAETLMVMPFPTWASRSGCPAGTYNSASSCELCPSGRANNETTAGLEYTTCAQCHAGQGTSKPGGITCQPCAQGHSQDGDRDAGICRKCKKGYAQDEEGSTACISCPLGSHAHVQGRPNCSSCSPGKYQNMLGQSLCSVCTPGTFSLASGHDKCTLCLQGTYAPEKSMTQCFSCPAGFTTQNIASEASSQCICPQDTYRVEGGMSCAPCKEGMTCPVGSDVANFGTTKPFPLLQPGFWSDPSGDLLSIYQCEDTKKCPGGPPGACGPRLELRSCAHCAAEYAWNGEECSQCSSIQTSKVLFLTIPCIVMPIVILTMYTFFRDELPAWGSYGNGIATVAYLTLNHYQVIDMLSDTATTPTTPTVAGDTLEIWTWSNDIGSLLAQECAGFRSFESSLITQVVLPLLLLLVAICVYSVSKAVAMFTGNPKYVMDKDRLCNIFMSLMFTFFNAVAALSVALFKCLDNPNDEKTLAADYSVVCGGEDWSTMVVVAVFAILLYVVGFAAVLLWVILTAHSKIHDPGFQNRWKFLFIKFRFDVWWWAMMYLAKGLFYNLGFVIFLRALQQLYWMFFLTTVYAVALVAYVPYRHRITINVDGMVCISIMYCCTFKMWFSPRVDGDMDDAVASVLVAGSLLPILVGSVVVLWMILLLTGQQSSSGLQMQKDFWKFIECLEELSMTEVAELRKVFQDVSEWDRWYIMQMVRLIRGERALGIVGNKRRSTLAIGRSTSPIGLEGKALQAATGENEEFGQEDEKCSEPAKPGQMLSPIQAVEDMDSELLLIRETHRFPRSSPRSRMQSPAWGAGGR